MSQYDNIIKWFLYKNKKICSLVTIKYLIVISFLLSLVNGYFDLTKIKHLGVGSLAIMTVTFLYLTLVLQQKLFLTIKDEMIQRLVITMLFITSLVMILGSFSNDFVETFSTILIIVLFAPAIILVSKNPEKYES